MKLSGVHLLLTYGCTYECDHCFVWAGPRQQATMRLEQIDDILRQARELGGVESIYFEGGEPFLYHPVLRRGVRQAVEAGFRVGLVSNAYWATAAADATEWLRGLAGLVEELSLSCDSFHGDAEQERRVRLARDAARRLGIGTSVLRVEVPPCGEGAAAAADEESVLMYRGRAARKLVDRAGRAPWESFDRCPYEDLRDPERVHVDPLGYVHLCQGIVAGNLFERPLREICRTYDPDAHPVVGPLLRGGPAELARAHGFTPAAGYADACHLCYEARCALRARFPEILAPDEMYGAGDGGADPAGGAATPGGTSQPA